MTPSEAPKGELVLYQTDDGRTRIECRFEGNTIWLTQLQLAELFETSVPNINLHLKAVYAEGELDEGATIKPYLIVRAEGKRSVSRQVLHYSLPAVLAVGFRVRSHRGTQFRKWAIELIEEFVEKGFVLDDERLKNPPGPGQTDYFDELLERIRDIRSSERRFYQKVLDIYALSADYDPRVEASRAFFKTVQNKLHWAAHGQTAAEVIAARADASSPNMGLTSWAGSTPRKGDVQIAKNYLSSEELEALNGVVSAYLEFAEFQAKNRRVMYMRDWIAKLDSFLALADKDVLTNAGKISHELAIERANTQYALFRKQQARLPSPAERDFEAAVARTRQLEEAVKKGKPRASKEKTS
ncbi:virulence RhuM family protein [Myxococcota bacterium]|nr:virulence RhuM family protein [Myxococcota bacterium]